MKFGIRVNLGQVLQQLLQVLLVGMTIGMMRNVVPALAESEFGVPRGSFMLLVAFVVAFGFVKGFNLFFEIQNLFDKTYVASANNISDSLNATTGQPNTAAVLYNVGGSIYAGAPRTFVGGLRIKL